jgi:hypothetical protein
MRCAGRRASAVLKMASRFFCTPNHLVGESRRAFAMARRLSGFVVSRVSAIGEPCSFALGQGRPCAINTAVGPLHMRVVRAGVYLVSLTCNPMLATLGGGAETRAEEPTSTPQRNARTATRRRVNVASRDEDASEARRARNPARRCPQRCPGDTTRAALDTQPGSDPRRTRDVISNAARAAAFRHRETPASEFVATASKFARRGRPPRCVGSRRCCSKPSSSSPEGVASIGWRIWPP